jgi:hypothetical protein
MINDYGLSFTSTYIALGLDPSNTFQRASFLSLLTICFLNQIEKNKHAEFISDILNKGDINEEQLSSFNFNSTEQAIVFQALQLKSTEKLSTALSSIISLLKEPEIAQLSRSQFITIYDQTLKRLIEPFKKNREAKTYDYELRPDDFSRFISAIYDKDDVHAYDAFGSTGELSNYLATINPNWQYTIESFVQNPEYLIHKFILSGCDNARVHRGYALSSTPAVEKGSFDLAFSLFEPKTITKLDSKNNKSLALKGKFDPLRINEDIIPTKYLEHALIQHLLWSINDEGMAIAFIGKGPLQRQEEKDARKFLLENNYVDAVVQLPSSLISAKAVDLYALILKKNRTMNDVLFVNVSEFYARDTKRNRLINEQEIAGILENRQNLVGISKLESVERIIFDGCLLNVTSYVQPIKPITIGESIHELSKDLCDQQKMTDNLFSKLKI